MKILIRGAGDLATGIAAELWERGHQILMTDVAIPLTVRREVAFSRAVYEEHAVVEGIEAVLAENFEEAETIMATRKIAVMVDEKAGCIHEFQPDVVVGFGGYVSGPVLQQAVKLGIPTCIHEQNAYPGITNKTLAKTVDRVMLTVEDAAKHLTPKNPPVVTGLPVRGQLLCADRAAARAGLGIPDGQMLVLSFGGSLGAKPLNEAMLPILLRHAEDGSCYHIHSVGTNGGEYLEKFAQAGFTDGRKGTVEVRQYIDNMDVCMAAADLVIGRAGASSLSEIEAMGKASILIPSPYVAENHQFHNAMALVNRNAARILEEKDLSADTLSAMMDELLSDKEKLFEIERNAKAMSVADARSRIADVILDLAKAK